MSRRDRGKRNRSLGREAGKRDGNSLIRQPPSGPPEEAMALLERADIVGHQLVPAGTNYTFAVVMSASDQARFLAIYKPRRGENPLWDFPEGTLYLRERAAYVASRFLGWPSIPPTVIREGPYGVGMVQLFIETEEQWDFSTLQRQRRRELMEVALFDLLVNNADRKAGHCLLGTDGRLWAIDHGLTFNVAPKLRTILWDYCGEPIPGRLLADLEPLREGASRRGELHDQLQPYLTAAEIEAFFLRLERILRVRKYPQLDPMRNVPWPLI